MQLFAVLREVWNSVSESQILMFELWNQKSPPKCITEMEFLLQLYWVYWTCILNITVFVLPYIIYFGVFPKVDAHEQRAQPLEPSSHIQIDQKLQLFLVLLQCFLYYTDNLSAYKRQ